MKKENIRYLKDKFLLKNLDYKFGDVENPSILP